MSIKQFYIGIIAMLVLSYSWIGFSFYILKPNPNSISLCLFKHTTHLPCPSCGITRSFWALLHGHVYDAILINPLSLVALFLLLFCSTTIIYDGITQKNKLWTCFQYINTSFKQKKVYIPATIIMLANWFWNIQKNL